MRYPSNRFGSGLAALAPTIRLTRAGRTAPDRCSRVRRPDADLASQVLGFSEAASAR